LTTIVSQESVCNKLQEEAFALVPHVAKTRIAVQICVKIIIALLANKIKIAQLDYAKMVFV
jgi:hypothetical protein